MRRGFAGAALLVLAVLLTRGQLLTAQKPAADKDLDNSEKMIRAGNFVGKIVAIHEDKRKIRLKVSYPRTKIDQGQANALQQAQRRLLEARLKRDANAMLQAQRDIVQAQAKLYTLETVSQEVELEAKNDVIVRSARPREDFDDKGRIKKLTKEELKELKGPDPKLPGYKAEFSDLTNGQLIQVTLVRKKGALAILRTPPRAKKGKDREAGETDLLANYAPLISLILIVSDPPTSR